MNLPPEVIQEDRDLQEVERSASEQLIRLRWHWTMDQSNPGRVSVAEYAQQVGVNQSTVYRSANGYLIFLSAKEDPFNSMSPSAAVHRADMAVDRRRNVDAVAKAHGNIHPVNVEKNHRDELNRVRDAVRDHVETHPTASDDELQRIADRTAKNIKTSADLARNQRDQLLQSQPHLLTEILGETAKARESLIKARALAKDADPSLLPADGLDRIDNALQEVARLASDTRSLLGRTAWDTAGLS